MKRTGNLIEAVADTENLLLAYWKALRGKRAKIDAQVFGRDLDRQIASLRAGIVTGDVAIGEYHTFRIYDPKERLICAPSFRERVLHHAIMNVCEPWFESYQIHDSYACRKGKGVYKALERAQAFSRGRRWYLKMDVRKYFDSIDHAILKALLRRRFKDAPALALMDRIVDTYEASPGKGVPIGALTSQYFANHYLAVMDHEIKESLSVRPYVRYMDDFVMWSDDREYLKAWRSEIEAFLWRRLKLRLKPPCLNATERGMSFLGYRVFPGRVLLTRRSRTRFFGKMRRYLDWHDEGELSEKDLARRLEPLLAFCRHAETTSMRRAVWV